MINIYKKYFETVKDALELQEQMKYQIIIQKKN